MQFPKTPGQCTYLRALQTVKPITIATGPAGSGKTILACQEASIHLARRRYDRIICTRPVVAADEDLGYLPGDMGSKMEPWAIPMLEFIEKYLTHNQVQSRVHIEPLGFMRGRTFDNTFVIADEMQNSTPNQMKMLLTRLGENSKMVVLGDLQQSDLQTRNGLEDIIDRIDCVEMDHVEYVDMSEDDVLRHPAVSEILTVYRN
jgi:phosphate starvation-inducible PhoH-like protein